jgi:hypothetical protein
MAASMPQNFWALIALGGALHYKGGLTAEAIDTAGLALALAPDHPDAVWLRAQTLAGDSKRREEAIKFIDSQRSRLKNPAENPDDQSVCALSPVVGSAGGRGETDGFVRDIRRSTTH